MNKLLNQIFRDYYQDVYRYLLSLSHNADLSEELTSDVFLSVVISFGRFRGDSDVKTWLFAIARNKYITYLRKKKSDIRLETFSEFIEDSFSYSSEDKVLIKEVYDRIIELLAKEDEKTEDIVLMRTDGYSFYEIAKKYGISENSARVIFHRAKERIKENLKKEGYSYE